ncbi:UNVERIFIED_ORG: MFS family permease [Arthrobacter sp. UYCu721]
MRSPGSACIASNQGMFVSTRPQERGVAAGIFQTCRYVGAITATVLIGVFAAGGVDPASWGQMVVAMLVLGAVAFGVTLLWKQRAD